MNFKLNLNKILIKAAIWSLPFIAALCLTRIVMTTIILLMYFGVNYADLSIWAVPIFFNSLFDSTWQSMVVLVVSVMALLKNSNDNSKK